MPPKEEEQLNFSLRESLLLREFTSLDDFLNAVDDRVNIKIAQGMKKALGLVVESLDQHVQAKVGLLVREEIGRREEAEGSEVWALGSQKNLKFIINHEIDLRILELHWEILRMKEVQKEQKYGADGRNLVDSGKVIGTKGRVSGRKRV